jgi:GH24 family phage-related lysozyme (muramidase)
VNVFSDKALKLILDEEGLDQPSLWPKGESGISIGRGYDLRWESNFESDWKPYLTPDEISRLKTVVGKQGSNELASQFKDIHITQEAADHVFYDKTLPEYTRQTRAAFPGFDNLPLDAQGALVSLVYNRGAGMSGDTRLEMRNIRDLVPNGDLQGIADQIRAMKRLWPDSSDLRNRRDHEADLVESCIIVSEITTKEEPIAPVERSSGIWNLIATILGLIFKKK